MKIRKLIQLLQLAQPDCDVSIGRRPGDGRTSLLIKNDPETPEAVNWIEVPVEETGG